MPATTHKVAHVLRRFTFSEWGGTETVVWNTALRQRARGAEPEILTTAALAAPGEERRDGIRIRRFPYWYAYFPMTARLRLELDKKGGNPFSPELFRALRRGDFDLIHIHCGGRLAVMCALLAHRLGIPCVTSLHGGFAAVPPEEVRKMMAPTRGRFHYGGIIDRRHHRPAGRIPEKRHCGVGCGHLHQPGGGTAAEAAVSGSADRLFAERRELRRFRGQAGGFAACGVGHSRRPASGSLHFTD